MSCIEHRVRNNLRSLRSRFYVAAVGLAVASGSFLQSGSALDWQAGNGWRSAQLPVLKSGSTGFTLLPPAVTGIGFTNQLSDTNAALNQIRLNGSGVAAGGAGGDGRGGPCFLGLGDSNRPSPHTGRWEIGDTTPGGGRGRRGPKSPPAVLARREGG